MAAVEGVKVHTQGRVHHSPSASVEGDIFSFRGGPTGCVMILEPMHAFLNYYEYEILARGNEASIGIGVGERNYPLNRMPGWNRNSIGYHGDDGKLYHENGGGARFGPTCTEGDRMGCGVDFESDVSYGYCEVFFTKNGQQVGDAVRMKKPIHGLYPIIGLHSRGEKVRYLGHWHRQRHSLLEPMIQDHSPSNMWLRSNGIKFVEDGLTLEYCGTGGGVQDVSLAQAKYPLDRTNYYFELTILDVGTEGAIAIGVGKSSYHLHNHPGWSVGAVGYHADDGKLFVGHGKGQDFGPCCAVGDTMGCGIVFDSHEEEGSGEAREEKGAWPRDESDEDYQNDLLDDDDEDEEEEDDSYSSDEDRDPFLEDVHDEAMFYRHLLGRERLFGGPPQRGRGGRRNIGRGLFGGMLNAPEQGFHRNVMPRRGLGFAPASFSAESVKSNSGSKCTVYFTKNGDKVGETEVFIPKGGFFPLVGLLSKGEKVTVNLQPLTG